MSEANTHAASSNRACEVTKLQLLSVLTVNGQSTPSTPGPPSPIMDIS